MRQIPHILQSTAAAALYAWAALFMAGCTPDEAAQPAGIAVPLQISSVSVVSPQAETVTRATYDDTFFDDVHPAIEVTRLANANYTNGDYEIYQLTDDPQYGYKFWQGKTGGLTLTQHPAEICTLFPEMGKDVKAIPIYPDQYAKSRDICYTPKQTVTASANVISLEMKHALSRLVIALRQSGGAFNLEEITIGDVPLESQLDITTGTYKNPPTLTGVWGGTVSPAKPLSGNFLEYDWLMIPFTTLVEGLKILLKMNGDYFSLTIPQATLPELKAGYQYRVEITANPTLVEVTSVTLVPWQDVTVGDKEWHPIINGGQLGINVPASEIDLGGTACTQADKNLLGSLLWAEGNLMGTSLNTKDYHWAPTQSDNGYYYMWNSSYIEERTPNGIDPCTLLAPEKYGTGWQTPTLSAMQALMRCTDLTIVKLDEGTADERRGFWCMKKDKGLFLPFADCAPGSGTTGYGQSIQYRWFAYWCREGMNDLSSWCVLIRKQDENPLNVQWGYYKDEGFPVRCAKEITTP